MGSTYEDFYHNACRERDALRAEVERLREERRWRDARTEPPNAPGMYVCLWSGGDMSTEYFHRDTWLGVADYAIAYWTPLPAVPAEESWH